MRGALHIILLNPILDRIILADAVSTSERGVQEVEVEDHLRGCREHVLEGDGFTRMPGSSPRMRGAQKAIGARMAPVRIIHADAGSTASPGPHGHSRGDHPRGCGEHGMRIAVYFLAEGSFPRMRGALVFGLIPLRIQRIIPADAGST